MIKLRCMLIEINFVMWFLMGFGKDGIDIVFDLLFLFETVLV